ncbi:MAG: hypothetical protein SPM02_00795 [Bacteroidales bacterium]|nr:hypothetical protein [Bacteroidales bacterium]
MTTTLHRLSRVKPRMGATDADSVRRMKRESTDERSRGMQILMEARRYYDAMAKFREDRERNIRYTYGDQWGDEVDTPEGRMTEENYIKAQGSIPLQNNLILRLVHNVVGTYIQQQTEPVCGARDRKEQQDAEVLSTLLHYNMQLNRSGVLNARSLEEFLNSGGVVHRLSYGWLNRKMDCWTINVQPNNFFTDVNMRDFRGWDCSFVGEIHDVSRQEVLGFAKSPAEYKRISEIYNQVKDLGRESSVWEDFGYQDKNAANDFLTPNNPSLCRVIEVWRKETKPRFRCHDWNTGEVFVVDAEDYNEVVCAENKRRKEQARLAGIPENEVPWIEAEWFIDSFWYYYFLSPMGDIIDEGETPYEHKSHPYVFKWYPFIDGKIHSFVSNVIDQQRYINRLITLQDWIMRASAKGVLLVPEDSVKGLNLSEITEQWSKFNGVIVLKMKPGMPIPQQISANSTNIGIHEMLALQMKLFEDISGVNGALQGKASFSGESGSHAQIMAQNAAVSLVDILNCYNEFVLDEAYKVVKNIQQFYDEKKIVDIVGMKFQNMRNFANVLDMETNISITQSTAAPNYRDRANEFLMQLFQQQVISAEQLLENGDFPNGDKILQSLRSQKEQLAQGQMPEGMSPEVMQQIQAGANPQAVAQLDRALRA